MVIYSRVQSKCYIVNINNTGIGVNRNFSIDRQNRHFACPFQAAGDTMQTASHNALHFLHHKENDPACYGKFQKCASLAARFLFTSYKNTWLTAVSSHCLAALRATVQKSHAAKCLLLQLEMNASCHVTLLRSEGHFRTIRTQVSQPPSAGNVAGMSELQAQNCMTPQQWTRFLRSVSVISENKTVIASIKWISCCFQSF